MKLDPKNARFTYVYGVALHSAGRTAEALAVLTRANSAHPATVDILQALASFYQNRGDEAEARRYADQLHAVVTAD